MKLTQTNLGDFSWVHGSNLGDLQLAEVDSWFLSNPM